MAQALDFNFGQGRWLSVKAHKAHRAGELQDPQPILHRNLDEDVSRKEHEIQFLAAIFPASHRAVQREKAGNAALLDFVCDSFLVARGGIEYVPVRSYRSAGRC